jgi:Holliday junction resolvase
LEHSSSSRPINIYLKRLNNVLSESIVISFVSYRSGRRLEYVVRDMFRRRGWFVVRAAASKPVDLVCLKGGDIVLVECKYGVRGVRWAELAPLLEAAEKADAMPVLAIAEKRGRIKMIDVWRWADFKP